MKDEACTDNDLIVDDPTPVIDYGLSYPPGETATEEQRTRFTAAIGRRFTNGHLRIHTRAGAFVSKAPRTSVHAVWGDS